MRRSLAWLAVLLLAAPPLFSQVPDASNLPVSYTFELEGLPRIAVSRVSGLAPAPSVIERQSTSGIVGMNTEADRAMAGRARIREIVIERPMDSRPFLTWRRQIRDGRVERRPAILTVADASGRVVARYRFRNMWPTQVEGTQLNNSSSMVQVETVHLAYESMEQLQMGSAEKP